MGANRRRSQQNKERVLAVAEQLVARKGVNGLTVRAVTAEAGLSVAMVSYYFGTASGLLEAVVDRHATALDRARVRALRRLREHEPEGHSITKLVRAFLAETLAYRWIGGTAGELLQALSGCSTGGLNRVRRELLGLAGGAATQMRRELTRLLPGIAEQKLWWRWQIAMGGIETALELLHHSPESADVAADELTEIFVSLLTAGTLNTWDDSLHTSPTPEQNRRSTPPFGRQSRRGDSSKRKEPVPPEMAANMDHPRNPRSALQLQKI